MTPHRWLAVWLAVMCAVGGIGAALLTPLHAKNARLEAELVAMQRAAESLRDFGRRGPPVTAVQAVDGLTAAPVTVLDGTEVATTDAANLKRLKEIVSQHGWPGKKLVGSDGSHAAWRLAMLGVGRNPATVAQDSAFLARVLVLMNRAGSDVSGQDRARLADRVAVMHGLPQTYGTQWTCTDHGFVPATPNRDRAGLAARRKAVGLPAVGAEFKGIVGGPGCGAPVIEK